MTVQVNAIWLHDAEDPADCMGFEHVRDGYQVPETLGGGVDHDYASGRSRGWSTESDVIAPDLPLENLAVVQLKWLRDHRGRTLIWRDPVGNRWHVMFHALPVAYSTIGEMVTSSFHGAALRLESVTFDEAV